MKHGEKIPEEIYKVIHNEIIGIDEQINILIKSKQDLFKKFNITYESYRKYRKKIL